MKSGKLNQYPLFLALTRKPMLFGVSQAYFIVISLIALCSVFLLLPNIGAIALILSGGFFIIFYFAGLIGYKRDENFFEIWIGKLSIPCVNKHYYGCDGYDSE